MHSETKFILSIVSLVFIGIAFQNCGQSFEVNEQSLSSESAPVTEPPAAAPDPEAYKSLANNRVGTCGLKNNGTVDCVAPYIAPAGLTDIKAIAGGAGFHFCAITKDDKVNCWGRNDEGQLGNDSLVSSNVPVEAAGLSGVKSISVGDYHSCALAANGISCWGRIAGPENVSQIPMLIPDTADATRIFASSFNTCFLTTTNAVKCLGVGGPILLQNPGEFENTLVPVTIPNLADVKDISVGYLHACAFLGAKTIKCWGVNSVGQIGDGTTNTASSPIDVTGSLDSIQVSASGVYTCALGKNLTLKCWGSVFGFGTPPLFESPTAMDVAGLSDIKILALSPINACAVNSKNEISCIGNAVAP